MLGRLCAALLVCLLAASQAVFAGSPTTNTVNGVKPLAVIEVASGIFVHLGMQQVWHPDNAGDIANLSFVIGDTCVAVIDTGSTLAIGARLKAAITAKTSKPVCFVVNTHAHPDHMLGNGAFKPATGSGVSFVGHKNLEAAIATRGPIYLRAANRDLGPTAQGTSLVLPDKAVSDVLELDLGGRKLQVKAWPTSHTDADVTVYEPVSKTLWLGDLSFVGHLPVVDGNLKGWLQTAKALLTVDVDRAIPGHGAYDKPGWPDMLDAQTAYLVALRNDVRKAIKDGRTLAEAVESVHSGGNQQWLVYDEFHKRNVSAAYAELEWE